MQPVKPKKQNNFFSDARPVTPNAIQQLNELEEVANDGAYEEYGYEYGDDYGGYGEEYAPEVPA